MRDFAEHYESRQDRKVIVRFFAYLKPHLKTFILAFVLMIFGTFTGMILPLASGLAIDQMQNPALNLEEKLWIVGIGTVVLLVTSGLSTYVSYLQNIGG